jgi:transposase-like protein
MVPESAFKARATLEAMKEQQTLVELGQRFQVHPNQMAQWKKQLLEL